MEYNWVFLLPIVAGFVGLLAGLAYRVIYDRGVSKTKIPTIIVMLDGSVDTLSNPEVYKELGIGDSWIHCPPEYIYCHPRDFDEVQMKFPYHLVRMSGSHAQMERFLNRHTLDIDNHSQLD